MNTAGDSKTTPLELLDTHTHTHTHTHTNIYKGWGGAMLLRLGRARGAKASIIYRVENLRSDCPDWAY